MLPRIKPLLKNTYGQIILPDCPRGKFQRAYLAGSYNQHSREGTEKRPVPLRERDALNLSAKDVSVNIYNSDTLYRALSSHITDGVRPVAGPVNNPPLF